MIFTIYICVLHVIVPAALNNEQIISLGAEWRDLVGEIEFVTGIIKTVLGSALGFFDPSTCGFEASYNYKVVISSYYFITCQHQWCLAELDFINLHLFQLS